MFSFCSHVNAPWIDKSKRGAGGEKGDRGEGDPGPAAKEPLIIGRKIDAENFRAVPFGADGKPLPELTLRPLFAAFINQTGGDVADVARQELERWRVSCR